MKIVYWILGLIILGFLGYYAFIMGWVLFKIFIGLFIIAIFSFGFYLGHISTKK